MSDNGCGYRGNEYRGDELFALYLNSLCMGGWLQDMNSEYDTKEKDYRPCPQCRQVEAMDDYRDRLVSPPKGKRGKVWMAWHIVMDIRRNKRLSSITLRQYKRHVELVNSHNRKKYE